MLLEALNAQMQSGGGVTAFKYSAGAAARSMPTYDDGSCNTLTADWHSPAIAVRTANTSANGIGVSEECAHTIDCAQPEAIAFTQNQRDEVRLENGDGSSIGALHAPSGKNEHYVCMAGGAAHAEVEVGGGGTDADRPQQSRSSVTSNGRDVFPSLCATDGKYQFIDNQSVDGGRLIIQPR